MDSMTPFEQDIHDQVVGIGRSRIPQDEIDVLRIIFTAWMEKRGKVTQEYIARELPNLGKHHREKTRTHETTLRRVRAVIRELRLERWAPIISDSDGYTLPHNQEEAREYIDRTAGEVRARAAAGFETYKAMRESLGISNKFLDGQEQLLDLPIAGEVPSATKKGTTYRLYHIAGRGWICECPGFKYRQKCRHADSAYRGSVMVRPDVAATTV